MQTKADFVAVIDQTADRYDQLAALRRAGDPRYFQIQEALATMFSMISQQQEVGMMEPFDKVRDSTILADAALKGILPKASPARVRLTVKNASKSAPFSLAAGRILTDSSGLFYVVDKPVTVPVATDDSTPGVATVEAIQQVTRTVQHTVTESAAFYSIQVPDPLDGRKLAGITVADSRGNSFAYAPGFTNVAKGDKVFHVEVDEYRRMFVRFGLGDIVGFQPDKGTVITLTMTECDGDVRPASGSPFNLVYAYAPADSMLSLVFTDLLRAGFPKRESPFWHDDFSGLFSEKE